MKFSQYSSSKTHQRRGVTLIELTVVIAVILLLVSILVVTSMYYTRAADRSACIININKLQKGIRSYENLNELKVGDPFTINLIVGPSGIFGQVPVCPTTGGSYVLPTSQVPPIGTAAVICEQYDLTTGTLDSTRNHTPDSTALW